MRVEKEEKGTGYSGGCWWEDERRGKKKERERKGEQNRIVRGRKSGC